jgi:hypothetical protein
VGTHNYAAQYSGDSNFLASSKTSAASALVVSKASTTTTVKSSNASITPGQSVTFTATITPQYAGAPTGNVTFYDGGTALGNGTVSGTTATFTTSALTPGLTHSIYATYNGDGNFTPSTSSTINETVAPLDFTLANGSVVTQSVPPGSTASFPFALAPLYGSYAGTVSFTSTGAPTGAIVTFSPATVPASGGAQTITMNVQTLPATSMLRAPRRGLGSLALGLLAWFGLRRIRRRGRALLWTLVLLAGGAAASLIDGCGGGGINGFFAQQSQNYAITMTATSGGIQHSASVTLNVQ